MKVEILNEEKEFKPVEIKFKIESLEELRAFKKLFGATTERKTPGSEEIWNLIKDIREPHE